MPKFLRTEISNKKATLDGHQFAGCDIDNSSFPEVENTVFYKCNIRSCSFELIEGSKFVDCYIYNCTFIGCEIKTTFFGENDFVYNSFSKSSWNNIVVQDCTFENNGWSSVSAELVRGLDLEQVIDSKGFAMTFSEGKVFHALFSGLVKRAIPYLKAVGWIELEYKKELINLLERRLK